MIESSSNSQIKHIAKLQKSAKYRRECGEFVAEGIKMVLESARYDAGVKIYISENAKAEYFTQIQENGLRANLEIVADKVFAKITETMTPQGVLAVVKMPQYDESIIERGNLVVCLENLQDPGNMGTILRTAEGAGVDAVIISKDSVDMFNPKVVRSTMGASFRVPFFVVGDFGEELAKLQDKGYEVYASSLQSSSDFREKSYDGKVALIVGNEANGIRPETQELANHRIFIPMGGELESLNASVAAALLMYEVRRRRDGLR
ncbi:TrmH family RNA methyltransferase [Eubacterium xylanophilum]|uniref:TrmH family RNA methyltransferase n=1 Tax=Eubacterium xylanophilum TaxID=39497 RepID=UPI00047E3263|nr:RNA methyltransferase [Eubacterium xylanophilum]